MNYIVPTLKIIFRQMTWIFTRFFPKLFLHYGIILFQIEEKIVEAKTDYEAKFWFHVLHLFYHPQQTWFHLIKELLWR
jgi:hypothetical protein